LKVAVHQPHYFPYPGFFHKVSLADKFVLMDDAQYARGYVNRNRILDVHGPVWLTVPIDKSQKFTENRFVDINKAIDWRQDHWKKLQISYANAKFFSHYRDRLEGIYKSDWNRLMDLDLESIKAVFEWLGIRIPIVMESELKITSKSTQRLVDVCKAVGADTYVSGRGGKQYMDESLFSKNGLTLEYQVYSASSYPQRHAATFVPDLSILDMLMNLGPASMEFISTCSRAPPEGEHGSGLDDEMDVALPTSELLKKNPT
jgi:hypothetical protein